MPGDDKLKRPVDVYKAIIDQLAKETTNGVSERLVTEECAFSKRRDEEEANAFVRSLSSNQRSILAGMLHFERINTIHDVLAVLSWWLHAGNVGLTFRNAPMPIDLSGMGLHGDYIGRLNNWEWPT